MTHDRAFAFMETLTSLSMVSPNTTLDIQTGSDIKIFEFTLLQTQSETSFLSAIFAQTLPSPPTNAY